MGVDRQTVACSRESTGVQGQMGKWLKGPAHLLLHQIPSQAVSSTTTSVIPIPTPLPPPATPALAAPGTPPTAIAVCVGDGAMAPGVGPSVSTRAGVSPRKPTTTDRLTALMLQHSPKRRRVMGGGFSPGFSPGALEAIAHGIVSPDVSPLSSPNKLFSGIC